MAIETAVRNTLGKQIETEAQQFLAKNYLFFQKKGIYHKVFIKDIVFIKSSDNYCEIYTKTEGNFILRSSISRLAEVLP
ncbi:MAG: hypothetical protein AAGI23_20350 [Bacteroidota bacterium]